VKSEAPKDHVHGRLRNADAGFVVCLCGTIPQSITADTCNEMPANALVGEVERALGDRVLAFLFHMAGDLTAYEDNDEVIVEDNAQAFAQIIFEDICKDGSEDLARDAEKDRSHDVEQDVEQDVEEDDDKDENKDL
jgi:hypothetical protein